MMSKKFKSDYNTEYRVMVITREDGMDVRVPMDIAKRTLTYKWMELYISGKGSLAKAELAFAILGRWERDARAHDVAVLTGKPRVITDKDYPL